MQKTGNPSLILAPKENSLVSRPSTSGSLKPRSASYRNHVAPSGKAEESAAIPVKSVRYRYRCISNNGEKRVDRDANSAFSDVGKRGERGGERERNGEERKNEEGNIGDIEQEHEEVQENYEGIEGDGGKEIENQDDFLRDGLSYVSGLTTTSQRKYINELETLLRQEKLRRIKLEESLQKVIEGKK